MICKTSCGFYYSLDHPIIAPVVADRPSPDVPLGEEWDYPESLECVPDNDFVTHTADRADAHIAFSTTEGWFDFPTGADFTKR